MPTLDSGQTPADAINQIYQSVLRREADPSGLSLWEAQFNAGLSLDSIRDSLVVSSEASRFVDPIVRLYEVAFGRQADETGLTNWINAFRNGTPLETIAQGFTGSQEFINRFGTSTDRSAFVESLYVNGLGRASDAAGKAFWVGSDFTDEQLLLGFSESPESLARLDDATTTFLTNLSEGIAADTSASLTSVSDTTSTVGGDVAEDVQETPVSPLVDDDVTLTTENPTQDVDQPGYFLIGSADADKLPGLGGDDIQLDIDDSVSLVGVSLGDFNSGDVLI